MTERLSNTVSYSIGTAQKIIGEAIGNRDMAASGAARQAQAHEGQRNADVQTNTEGIGHSVEGEAQQKVGTLTGDQCMQAKGTGNEAVGEVERNT